jgi:acetylornithine deacetylase/succinyl-diaminopimelate desuccinylase-like protein
MSHQLSETIRGVVASVSPWLDRHDERVLGQQTEIAEVAAPTGAEGERAAMVARLLTASGLQTEEDAVGNILAFRPGTVDAPPVVLCAHLDTVFGAEVEHRVVRDGAVLRGPGIGDNARGLAGMLTIARALDAMRVRTKHPVLFAATVGEEGQGNLRGARHLFSTRAADAVGAIVLDGPGDDHVVTHALGVRRYRVSFDGRGGHSWSAGESPNALHAAARAAAALTALRLPSSPRTTLVVARFESGGAINAVPGHAEFDVDLRSLSSPVLEALSREIALAVALATQEENQRARGRDDSIRSLIESLGSREAGVLDAHHAIGEAAVVATAAIGRRAEACIASTDANVPLSLGMPAIAIGAGGVGGGAHTAGEWFENREGSVGIARAMGILVGIAGVSGPPGGLA